MKSVQKLILALTLIFFVSFTICILTGPVELFSGFESASVNQFEKMQTQGIILVDINVPDPDLNVYPINGTEFEFNFTGNYAKNEYSEKVNLSVERVGEIVKVRIIYPRHGLILINKDFDLIIGVPENYSGKMIITSASGDIEIKDLNLENFEINTASGEIEVKNLTSNGQFLVESMSGNINLEEIKSENLKVESVSGDILTNKCIEKIADFKSVSGNVLINFCENINFVKTTSGDIKVLNYFVKKDINFETISGEVDLELLKNSSFNLEFKSVSGNLENDFVNVEKGENNLFVKTTSGDLKISVKN